MAHSNVSASARVDSPPPAVPPTPATLAPPPTPKARKRKKIPLGVHKGTGYWCKRIRGRVYYFGKVAEDPDGVRALEQYERERGDLEAGREPRDKVEGATVAYVCNKFLANKEELRDRGEVNPRSYEGYFATCKRMTAVFGRERAAADLKPDDFRKLRASLAETRAAVSLRNEMQRVRSVLKFAFEERLIPVPAEYGQGFAKPKLDAVRRDRENHRNKHGDRMFEAADIRRILADSTQPLKTMVLLAANGGFGQSDLSALPTRAVNLETGWVDFARVKTAVRRRIPLWPETVEAIRDWLKVRPKAADPADAGCLFLTVRGTRWIKLSKPKVVNGEEKPGGTPSDAVGQEFGKVLNRLGLKRPGVSFYALRHGFETIAGETADQVAVDAIMGHVPHGMSANYRERIGEDRLRRVVNHVRNWLFAGADPVSDPGTESPTTSDPRDPIDPDDASVGRKGPLGSLDSELSNSVAGRPVLRLFRSDEIGGAA